MESNNGSAAARPETATNSGNRKSRSLMSIAAASALHSRINSPLSHGRTVVIMARAWCRTRLQSSAVNVLCWNRSADRARRSPNR